jgi:hypothetical protein
MTIACGGFGDLPAACEAPANQIRRQAAGEHPGQDQSDYGQASPKRRLASQKQQPGHHQQ